MLHPAMTRFHIAIILALVLDGIALALNQFILFVTATSLLLVAIGLGVAFPQLRFFGPFVCRGNRSRRCVALTFDDGPDARSTPALLDLLRESQVKAAFFAVGGKVAANPELSARIVGEGHLLENHSHTHHYLTNFFTITRLQTELKKTGDAIQKNAGVMPKFFRPPMGLSNPRIFRAARHFNLQVIGWTIRSLDTISGNPEKIVGRIVKRLGPGAIILLHDGNIPAERLTATVKKLLASLRELDYEVARLDQLLK